MTDTVASHLVKAQTTHNETRAQRNLLLEALRNVIGMVREPCSRPIGAPNSAARQEWEWERRTYAEAQRAIALCDKGATP